MSPEELALRDLGMQSDTVVPVDNIVGAFMGLAILILLGLILLRRPSDDSDYMTFKDSLAAFLAGIFVLGGISLGQVTYEVERLRHAVNGKMLRMEEGLLRMMTETEYRYQAELLMMQVEIDELGKREPKECRPPEIPKAKPSYHHRGPLEQPTSRL